MRTGLIALAALIALTAFAACGDDDDGASPTPSDDGTPPAVIDGSPEPTEPVDGNGDEKTPPAEESPADTVAPTAPGDAPTAPPPAAQGTPATEISESDFIAQVQGQPAPNENCLYNPGTALTTCPDHGEYAIDPPIVGQDVTCLLWLIDDEPFGLQCNSIQPAQTKYYQIQIQ